MFEFLSFELIVHDSAGGVVFRVVTWMITVIIGAVRALCENAPFAPTSPNNLVYLLAVSKNPAHSLHPVYDDGKGGGWKWWG